MQRKNVRVPVSRRAVLQRIHRALKRDGKLLVLRGGDAEWHVIDTKKNTICESGEELNFLVERTAVLKPWEKLNE